MSLFEEEKVGDPWSVLPIKNAKQARDCVEVHLGNRGCHRIVNFEQFPNVEVVWLNSNKVSRFGYLQLKNLDGLEANFRIKQVYCQDNMIENLEGIKRLKFLDVLLTSNNKLKDLDKTLQFLSRFSFLQQLDLFGNPVAQEPDYRLRVIIALPQLKIFDRHPITMEERIKAQKYQLKNAGPVPPHLAKKKKVVSVSQAFSKAQKDLYKEVEEVKMKTKRFEQSQEERILRETEIKFYVPDEPPLAASVLENQQKFADYSETTLSPWEKNIVKVLFQAYDKDKSSYLSLPQFKLLFQDLANDKGYLGKVSNLTQSQVEELFENWDKKKDDKISWVEFREGMNSLPWVHVTQEEIKTRCEELFKQAYKAKMMGNEKESREIARKAVSLQGSLIRDQPLIKKETKKVEKHLRRGDMLNLTYAQKGSADLKKQSMALKKNF